MSTLARAALVATVAAALAPAPARACDSLDSWDVVTGCLEPTLDCRGFIASSNSGVDLYSACGISRRQVLALPIEVSVTWRRLGPESAKPLELNLLGASVLFSDESYGMWSTQARWVDDGGWRPLPGYRTHDEHRITARQTAHEIVVLIDGRPAIRYPFETPISSGRPGISFKSARAYRSRVLLCDFSARSLGSGGQAGSVAATSASIAQARSTARSGSAGKSRSVPSR
jgi:hypothetical protein